MKFRSKLLALGLSAATALLTLAPDDADARRIGGGASLGRQSVNVLQRPSAPAAAPAPAGAASIPAGAPAPTGASRWLAPLTGVAAGMGLATLFGHLGIGEEVGVLALLALLALAVFAIARRVLLPRNSQAPAWAAASYSRESLGREATVPEFLRESVDPANRPPAPVVSGAVAEPTWRIPNDFDVAAFVKGAKARFVALQAAFDAADLEELREFTTAEMFEELRRQLRSRGDGPNRTDVVTLDAELLGIETTAVEHIASVRFHGLVREDDGAAQEFDEVWNLTKPVSGESGWLLAGLQQLD